MQDNEDSQERFLGMTKFQFMGTMMVLIVLLFAGTVFNLAFSVRANQERLTDITRNAGELSVLAEQAAEDHLGLCGLIEQVDARVDLNRKILAENKGDPITYQGLTFDRALLEDSVARDGETLNSLRPVDCSGAPAPPITD